MGASPARHCLVNGKTAPALGPNFGWRYRLGPSFVAAVEHGLGAAILRPAGNVVAHRHRALLAVGNRADALGIDAVLGQEVAHRLGAPRTQSDVVLAGAALVGVALDGDGVLRVL